MKKIISIFVLLVVVSTFGLSNVFAAQQKERKGFYEYTLNWKHGGKVTKSSIWTDGKIFLINADNVKILCSAFKIEKSVNVRGQFIRFRHNMRYQDIKLINPECIIPGTNIVWIKIEKIPKWMTGNKALVIKRNGYQYYINY